MRTITGAVAVCAAALIALAIFGNQTAPSHRDVPGVASHFASPIAVAELPKEARKTLDLIKQGGPFPYRRDGAVFGNFEGRLPFRPRGYYREYTVRTPGLKSRGARRIVSGSTGEYYYTDDHYLTFKRINE